MVLLSAKVQLLFQSGRLDVISMIVFIFCTEYAHISLSKYDVIIHTGLEPEFQTTNFEHLSLLQFLNMTILFAIQIQ